MNHIEYRIKKPSSEDSFEMLVATLDQLGYTGFVEEDEGFLVYIPASNENFSLLKETVTDFFEPNVDPIIKSQDIPEVNWNAEWESSFNPISVDNEVMIRASFHQHDPSFPYDLVINPKMAFGTGHHETTRLMIKALLGTNPSELRVLDLGTGTGILAMLALKMKASHVVAADIDQWAYDNAKENFSANNCSDINLYKASVKDLPSATYDLVMANINRNVLLDEMKYYAALIPHCGTIILSGFLDQDMASIRKSTSEFGMGIIDYLNENNWVAVKVMKKS